MSWILGAIGISTESADRLEEIFGRLHPEPLHRLKSGTIRIVAGGRPDTCLRIRTVGSELLPEDRPERFVLGTGFLESAVLSAEEQRSLGCSRGTLLMREVEWQRISSAETDHSVETGEQKSRSLISRIDGHFLLLDVRHHSITAMNDPIGWRSLYAVRTPDGLLFSTRLDWLARIGGNSHINTRAFSSHWLTNCQSSFDSLLGGVERLGPGGTMRLEAGRIEQVFLPWSPPFPPDTTNRDAFASLLSSKLFFHDREDQSRSLGLSGGLDSRLLLSLVEGASDSNYHLHTFGPTSIPDVQMAVEIARTVDRPIGQFDMSLPPADDLFELVQEFAVATSALSPASSMVQLRYYSNVAASGNILVDGADGETYRRQFFKRLTFGLRSVKGHPDVGTVIAGVRQNRGDWMSHDLRVRLEKELPDAIAAAIATMPQLGPDCSAGRFADLYAVRYRMGNYGGYAQAYTDQHTLNVMPYTHVSLIEHGFGLAEKEKQNGRLVRDIIHQHAPQLETFPLVAGDELLPYRLTPAQSWIWKQVRSRFGRSGGAPSESIARAAFLKRLEEPIRQMISDRETRECGWYDGAKLDQYVEEFYGRDVQTHMNDLDWWIVLELWRRSITRGV